MSTTSLALVIHFHQPVGNLDRVVRDATDRCYRPFLEVLASHPGVPVTLHYSGCLLEWLERNAADVADTIAELVARDQVELMTGGFYEPVLAAFPNRDQVGQIEMMTRHLRERYGAEPSGAWLTERVWEQDVVPALARAGVAYTVVDDTMFHAVGIGDERLTGPFITDHEEHSVLVYAGDRALRYLIPYKKVARALDHVQSSKTDRLFVYADDGEKFGEWPDTYERVYEKRWLRSFLSALVDQEDVALTKLGSYSQRVTPAGRVYLPSSSYDEMMTWALPPRERITVGRFRRERERDDPDGVLPFVKGAPWRSFLARYPEVNALQKRVLEVSAALRRADASEDSLRELYRAQCNCAYWHGSFGGAYISFMRAGLWHHLLRAEAEVAPRDIAVTLADVDRDGADEVVLSGPWGKAVADPRRGARLVELDDYSVGANLLTVMARREEAYHLADENPPPGEDDGDEMAPTQARPALDRSTLTFDEDGTGALLDRIDGRRVVLAYDFEATLGALHARAEHGPLRIDKHMRPDAAGLWVTIELTNAGRERFAGTYGLESFVAPLNLGRELDTASVDTRGDGWTAGAPEAEVCLEAGVEPAGRTSWERVTCVCATLEGAQEMPQGVRVVTEWGLELDPGKAETISIRLRVVVAGDRDKKDRGVSA